MNYPVGLTGGIGSGKSTVADMFAALSVRIVDTDLISRELTQAGGTAIPAIRNTFGTHVIDAQGALKGFLLFVQHECVRAGAHSLAEQASERRSRLFTTWQNRSKARTMQEYARRTSLRFSAIACSSARRSAAS